MKLQHLEGDTNSQMSMIDAKTRQLIDELKANIINVQSTAETEREKTEQRLKGLIDKLEGNQELNIVSDFYLVYINVDTLISKRVKVSNT